MSFISLVPKFRSSVWIISKSFCYICFWYSFRCWLESSFVGTKPVVKVVVNENGKANGNDHDNEHNNDDDNDHDNDDTSQSQSQLEVEIDNPIQSYSTPPSPR